jgi:hemerythrin-like domain-containing protein
MDVLQSFVDEHRLIAQVLAAFEGYVDDAEAQCSVDRADLQRFVSFFQNFAHLHHHDKEEALLFPALVLGGLDWNDEPLARVRAEHDQEHYLMSSLSHSSQQTERWSEDDRLHFVNVAKAFIAFQREHMRAESTSVYPLAYELSEPALLRLSHDVFQFDERVRSGNERMKALADVLVRRYTPPRNSSCVGANPPGSSAIRSAS